MALIVLEDGSVFKGRAIAALSDPSGDVPQEVCGEMVFNTSMSGYQEILTDPSYAGQIVTMTYPLIGNYGVNPEDVESNQVQVSGFIVKEMSPVFSNWRATMSLAEYLRQNRILAVEGVDTRRLTKHLREHGAMRGIISLSDDNVESLLKKVKASPSMEGQDLAKTVTTAKPYVLKPKGPVRFKVAALDCGMKKNIGRILVDLGCEVHVLPVTSTAQDIEALKPDGVFISNGPGDPAAVTYAIDLVRSLLGKYPMFGICLGHQIIALALGAKTYKLKFGHRGANHPVQDLCSKKVDISAQNHGFCVDGDSLSAQEVEVSHLNLNDHTVAGIRHKHYPVYSVQYHPEASPGPQEAKALFNDFIQMMEDKTYAQA